jgi:hypothetical protein
MVSPVREVERPRYVQREYFRLRTGFRMPAMAGPSTRAGRRPESVEARNRGFGARRWRQLVSRLWGLYESADGDECPDCWGERIV